MALPRLNTTPKYELTIPSTGQRVKFRPYLVKEEKILLLAKESNDPAQKMSAMIDTILACIEDDIDKSKLTIFDVEYMFVKIRTKAVGETADVNILCKECKHPNEVTIKIDTLTVDIPDIDMDIKIDNDITIKMKWPTYTSISDNALLLEEKSLTNLSLRLVIACIDKVNMADESVNFDDETYEEQIAFIDSFTEDQMNMINEFLKNIPMLDHEVKFDCEKCETENKLVLKGTDDFFP